MVGGSLREGYAWLRQLLSPLESPDFEAAELVKSVCGVTREELLFGGRELSPEEAARLEQLAHRRLEGYPLQYLLGEWDFWGRTFLVGEGVLIPRCDTEALLEVCLELLGGIPSPRILDLCTGTGCLAITLALEREDSQVWAVEKSPKAYEFFQKNNARFGSRVRGVLGDALEFPVPGDFDLILSNPPYLTREELSSLQREVSFEPKMALDGGEDGLFFYRAFAKSCPERLRPGGFLAFEVGDSEGEAVLALLKEAGLFGVSLRRDLNGLPRVVFGRKSS